MAGLTFSSFVSEIATLTAISSSVLVTGDNNFSGIMGGIIDYAEGRLWRELDLPVVSVTDTSVSCSSGVRSISLSTTQGTLLAITTLNLLTSAGATSSYATRVPLVPASQAVVDAIYPSATSSNCGQPQYFTRVSDVEIVFGPPPDQAYGTEVIATTRPTALSSTNTTTWLSVNVPELMVAAGMIFASGYMRDFGAQSDNPQMAQSWEGQYQALFKSMDVDSARMKFESAAWTSQQPAPIATPPRA
jgi:hypothetical protein